MASGWLRRFISGIIAPLACGAATILSMRGTGEEVVLQKNMVLIPYCKLSGADSRWNKRS